jgi:hypothetical protein
VHATTLTEARALAGLTVVAAAGRWGVPPASVAWVETTAPTAPAIDYLHALGARDLCLTARLGDVQVRVEVTPHEVPLLPRRPADRLELLELDRIETRPAPARASAIRAWARSTGISMSDFGPVPVRIVEAYALAHPR